MIIGILGVELDGLFAIRNRVVVIVQFVVAAAKPVNNLSVVRIGDRRHLQSGDSARIVSGVELTHGVLEGSGGLRRKAGCREAAAYCKLKQKKHRDKNRPQHLLSAVHYCLASVARTSMPSRN